MVYDPLEDGVSHLNVYSKGLTALGRNLSNFAHSPFVHPRFGGFQSVEGLWYWLGTSNEQLRELSGFEAKKVGRASPSIKRPYDEFKLYVEEGIIAKLEAYPQLKNDLVTCSLPLTHYYLYGKGENSKIVTPENNEWILAVLESVRLEFNPQADRSNIVASDAISKLVVKPTKRIEYEDEQFSLF